MSSSPKLQRKKPQLSKSDSLLIVSDTNFAEMIHKLRDHTRKPRDFPLLRTYEISPIDGVEIVDWEKLEDGFMICKMTLRFVHCSTKEHIINSLKEIIRFIRDPDNNRLPRWAKIDHEQTDGMEEMKSMHKYHPMNVIGMGYGETITEESAVYVMGGAHLRGVRYAPKA